MTPAERVAGVLRALADLLDPPRLGSLDVALVIVDADADPELCQRLAQTLVDLQEHDLEGHG